MLRWACVPLLIVAAGCDDVPELTFVGSDGGALDGGDDGTGGVVSCGTIMCIDRQQPGQCNCADCINMTCTGGKVCCYDSNGTGSCKGTVMACTH